MKLNELIENTPPELRPIVAKYAPALVEMTAEEFCAWLELLVLGRTYEAWESLMARQDNPGLLEAWRKAASEWDDANARNAERVALQRQALLAVLKVLLAAALAGVGL
jgi:hypothetical protein